MKTQLRMYPMFQICQSPRNTSKDGPDQTQEHKQFAEGCKITQFLSLSNVRLNHNDKTFNTDAKLPFLKRWRLKASYVWEWK